jgi:hypothetical protein
VIRAKSWLEIDKDRYHDHENACVYGLSHKNCLDLTSSRLNYI